MVASGRADRLQSEVLATRRGSEFMTSSPMDIISKEPSERCCRCCNIYTINLTFQIITYFLISFQNFKINYLNIYYEFCRHILGQNYSYIPYNSNKSLMFKNNADYGSLYI